MSKYDGIQTIRNQPGTWERWIESAVGSHLLNRSLVSDFDLSHWRHSNDEVDFVLKRGDKVIGLEVKSSPAERTTGMQTFSKKFQPHKVLLVGDSGLPWQEFLSMDPADLF